MSTVGRLRAEALVAGTAFLRRRTAVFFTFFFPVILVLIFGALVRTDPTGGGLFAEPPGYYVAGYLAVVVLFTPLSRLSSEVARHRDGNRFEKLATTPLTRGEWLVAQTAVNTAIIAVACLLILALVLALTGAEILLSPLLAPLILVGVVCFCGIGALIGCYTASQDGAIAVSNTLGLPLLFLSETFVAPEQLPGWFEPIVALSPLTYFARGVREATLGGSVETALVNLAILGALALVAFALGARAIPRTD